MSPGKINLHHYRGDTWGGMGPIRVGRGRFNAGEDLASLRMQIRKKPLGPVILELSSADPDQITILSASERRFVLPKQALALEDGRFVYDIEMVGTEGTVQTPIEGRLILDVDITREEAGA